VAAGCNHGCDYAERRSVSGRWRQQLQPALARQAVEDAPVVAALRDCVRWPVSPVPRRPGVRTPDMELVRPRSAVRDVHAVSSCSQRRHLRHSFGAVPSVSGTNRVVGSRCRA